MSFLSFFFFWLYWGLNSRTAWQVLDRCSMVWAPPSAFFALFILDRVSSLCLGLPGLWSSYLCFLSSWDDQCEPPQPAFIGWHGVLRSFCPGWSWTTILQSSASWVARITGVKLPLLALGWSWPQFSKQLGPQGTTMCLYGTKLLHSHLVKPIYLPPFSFSFCLLFEKSFSTLSSQIRSLTSLVWSFSFKSPLQIINL
jgi:hypothetical protein